MTASLLPPSKKYSKRRLSNNLAFLYINVFALSIILISITSPHNKFYVLYARSLYFWFQSYDDAEVLLKHPLSRYFSMLRLTLHSHANSIQNDHPQLAYQFRFLSFG